MKKLSAYAIMTAFMAMSLGGQLCGVEKREAKMKTLVVYYSYSGKTEVVAKELSESIKADILKIEDVSKPSMFKAYTSGAIAARKGKPWPIKPFTTDLTGYDRIFIGCPVWFGMPAPEINAFIDQADLKDKQIVVFVTMGGSMAEGALKALTAKIAAKSGKIVSSFSVKTGMMKNDDLIFKTREIAKQY
jgi:flavodoxin